MALGWWRAKRGQADRLPMTDEPGVAGWTWTAYAGLGAALVFVLGVAVWGVYHDLQLVRSTFVQSEIGRLRSHAVRTVGLIQDEIRASSQNSTQAIAESTFLRRHWDRWLKTDRSRVYAAVVDNQGTIVAHSIPQQEDLAVDSVWYDRLVPEAGDDVVETDIEALTGGQPVLDVRVPIYVANEVIGHYHSGLSRNWLEESLRERSRATYRVWAVILSVMCVVMLTAGVSLLWISRRLTQLSESIKISRVRRLAELGQLMAGIVHEIRNPLNAMRLNLHVLARQHRQAGGLPRMPADEASNLMQEQVIRETNHEIERVEGLLRILLGYARPDVPNNEDLDVRTEVEATLTFLRPLLDRGDLLVKAQFPPSRSYIHMDRDRLRQVLLNLINNARDAMPEGGQVLVAVTCENNTVEICVSDEGPGVASEDRERIFEPFFSRKRLGTGLGLAIVRRYLEEIGGTIRCEANSPRGALFRMRIPQCIPSTATPGISTPPVVPPESRSLTQ